MINSVIKAFGQQSIHSRESTQLPVEARRTELFTGLFR